MINAIANPTMPEKGERYLGDGRQDHRLRCIRLAAPARMACCTSPSCGHRGGARNVEDVVSVGQKIQVEINEVDDRGKLSLSPWSRNRRPSESCLLNDALRQASAIGVPLLSCERRLDVRTRRRTSPAAAFRTTCGESANDVSKASEPVSCLPKVGRDRSACLRPQLARG